eukprot:SAG11_NODE_20243_length_449_cov_2.137143_1_plen_96_part_00
MAVAASAQLTRPSDLFDGHRDHHRRAIRKRGRASFGTTGRTKKKVNMHSTAVDVAGINKYDSKIISVHLKLVRVELCKYQVKTQVRRSTTTSMAD